MKMNILLVKSRLTAYPLKAKVVRRMAVENSDLLLKMVTMTFLHYWMYPWEVTDRDHMILTMTRDTQHASATLLDPHQAFQVKESKILQFYALVLRCLYELTK